jgi:integrase
MEHAKASGAYVDPVLGRITFAAWAREWRRGVVDLRPSTLARDDGYLKRYLLPAFGEKRLADIDHAMVRAWIAELSARGLAPSTVVLAGILLRKIMATAVAAGRIASSPCNGVRLPRIEREEARYLTPAELTNAMDERYRGLVVLGAYGGMRIGEMLGLRAQHLDLLHGRVNVAEILVEVSGQLYFGSSQDEGRPAGGATSCSRHRRPRRAPRSVSGGAVGARLHRPRRWPRSFGELAPALLEAGGRGRRSRAVAPARSSPHRSGIVDRRGCDATRDQGESRPHLGRHRPRPLRTSLPRIGGSRQQGARRSRCERP